MDKEAKKKVGNAHHHHHRRISSGASHAPKTEEDQYGTAQLFLPDNAPKEKKVGGAGSPVKIKKVVVCSKPVVMVDGEERLSICRLKLPATISVSDQAVKSRPHPPRCTAARNA